MGGKSQTQTTQSGQTYTPTGLSGLQDIWSRVQNVASQPYTPYSGELTAPVNAQQNTAISNINSSANAAQPYINTAANYAQQGASPINAGQINNYLNPYNQSVIDATQAQFNNQNAQQQAGLKGNAISQGALGGNRVGVAQGTLAGQQQLAQAPVIAGLNAQNYNQALNAAQADRAAQQQGANIYGNLGVTAQNAALQGAGAQLGAGTLQQQTQQGADTANYNQYLQQLAFPYQQAQFLAGIGLPALTAQGGTQTGTGSTTTPGPSQAGQIAGLGLTALSLFSDRNAKKNIEKVGELYDGQPVYRYQYKGSPTTQIGLIAQNVEKKNPDAVGSVGGVKTVNYETATDSAADRGKFASGGAVDPLSSNFLDTIGYIPKIQVSAGSDSQASNMSPMKNPQFTPQQNSSMPSAQALSGGMSGLQNLFGDLGGYGYSTGSPGGTNPFGGSATAIYARGGAVNGYADGGQLPSVGVPASPEDLAMMREDVPLTPERANMIYDAYVRAGGGSDISNNQFVKNSQFGIMPWSQHGMSINGGNQPTSLSPLSNDIMSKVGRLFRSPNAGYALGGDVIDMSQGQDGSYSASPFNQAFAAFTPPPTAPAPSNIPESNGFMPAGSAAPPMAAPTQVAAAPVASVPSAPFKNPSPPQYGDQYANAISSVESGGDYKSIGPETHGGDRALGKYQVMASNVPEWTAAVLGKPMTPEQFLANPDAQDAVFKAKFGSYVDKYGPEGAAKAWFAGENGMNDPNRRDVLGTSVADYGRKFTQALGFGGQDQPSQNPLSNLPAAMNGQTPQGPQSSPGFLANLLGVKGLPISDSAKLGLLSAGLGAMASKSPFALTQIGEGGLQGVQTYAQAKHLQEQNDIQKQSATLRAQQLAQEADRFSKQYGLQKQTAQDTASYHKGLLERENNKFIGTTEDGFPVFQNTRDGTTSIGDTKLQGKAPSGYVRNADGSMAPIKGGPADPVIVKGISDAKRGAPIDDQTADFAAERVLAGDYRALTGWGRGAQGSENLAKIQGLVARKAAEKGLSAGDILAKVADQSGLTAQQRTFGTQTARMAINSTEAQGAIELGRQASSLVPRGNWVPINRVIQAYQSGTSDPALAKFGAANLAIINTYARAISPTGVPTVNDKEHAEKLLSTATSQDAYNAVLDQMNAEINIAHAAPAKAKKELEAIRKGVPHETQTAPSSIPQRVRQNGHTYERQPDGSMKAID